MKISNLTTQSFKALMIERGEKTPIQKEKIKKIAMSPEITQSLIERLEETGTDFYISASKDKENVNLKLKTAAGLQYSFIPRDEEGLLFTKIKSPKKEENKIMNFLIRAKMFNENVKHSGQNKEEVELLENLTEKDLLSSFPHQTSHPNMLPDADCYFGIPQVATKDFLRR